jgi:aminoglycoside phosphotransferase (APT) family kinase protein
VSDAEALDERLAEVLAQRWKTPVKIDGLHQLSGGASRETWSFTATTDRDERRLILRRDPPGVPTERSMAREAQVLRVVREHGVPVPELFGDGDGSDGVGSAYLIAQHLDGETIPRRLLRDENLAQARAGLPRELGRVLAGIHAVPLPELPELNSDDPLDELEAMHEEFDEPRPALEVGLRWLRENRPPAVPARLVHGDFRHGNLIVGPDGLVAVLDWEITRQGDPVQDLGWLCVKAWRFGAPAPVGGFGPREELLDGYAEVAGWRPSMETLRWWEVYGTASWAVICRRQAERHLGGSERSVEMAVLGRRICESEHDVLLALGLTEPREVADPLDEPVTDPAAEASPHDRPSVDELLSASARFLREDVVPDKVSDRIRFHSRVAANALTIARRELRVGAQQRRDHQRRLERLGCAGDRELVAAIRSGSLDERWDEVLDTVRELLAAKLTVANPRYLAAPGA